MKNNRTSPQTQARRLQSQFGQGIVEVLIATAVVAVVLTAVSGSMLLSIKNTAQSKYRSYATSKAQEAMEVFRRERVRLGWTIFSQSASVATVCMNTLPTAAQEFSDYVAANSGTCEDGVVQAGTEFTREALIDRTAGGGGFNQVRVEIVVTWTDAGIERSTNVVQEFREYEI